MISTPPDIDIENITLYYIFSEYTISNFRKEHTCFLPTCNLSKRILKAVIIITFVVFNHYPQP